MAKAPATPQADAAAAAPPPPKSKKLLVIIVAAVLVVLVAVAAVVALLLLKKGGAAEEHAEAAAPALDLSKPPAFVTLDPFVVNLAPAEGERYLQVVIALRVTDPKTGESLKGYMPAIRHRINLLLSSKLPSELSTLEGREDLADDIVEESNAALGFVPSGKQGADQGPIQAVLFNSFIIQ